MRVVSYQKIVITTALYRLSPHAPQRTPSPKKDHVDGVWYGACSSMDRDREGDKDGRGWVVVEVRIYNVSYRVHLHASIE